MSTDDAMLVDLMVDFATEVRMGNGVDIDVVSQIRRELEDASRRWSANGGVVPGATVGVLLSFYPALIGALGLYDVDESHTIEILTDELLECMLASVDPDASGDSL